MQGRRYLIEFGASLSLYILAVMGSSFYLTQLQDGPVKSLVAILPILPMLGVAWAVIRQIRRLDELQRRVQLEALSIAFVATASITFSYGFLEVAGLPRLSMFFVWPLMAVFWMLGSVLASRRYR